MLIQSSDHDVQVKLARVSVSEKVEQSTKLQETVKTPYSVLAREYSAATDGGVILDIYVNEHCFFFFGYHSYVKYTLCKIVQILPVIFPVFLKNTGRILDKYYSR